MVTLIEYLETLNAKTREWVAAGPDRWASEYTTDPSHWDAIGIKTVGDFELYQAEVAYSDLFKDVHGYRPSGYGDMERRKGWTVVQYETAMSQLSEELTIQTEYERKLYQMATVEFEIGIATVMASSDVDRATALRWLWQADLPLMGNDRPVYKQDIEQFVYNNDLLFGDYGRQLVDELTKILGVEI